MPGIADDMNLQLTKRLEALPLAEANQSRRRLNRHVPRQFQRVTLGPTEDAIIRTKQSRYNVQHTRRVMRSSLSISTHLLFFTSSSKCRYQAGNIHAQRCS